MPRLLCFAVLVATLLMSPLRGVAADTATLVLAIKSVGREGQGNRAANQAVVELSQQDVSVLPTVLMGFRDANPLAVNYLRGAVESIADRALKNNKALPKESLEKLIRDVEQDPRGRRLAYELLVRVEDSAADRIIPDLLLDPSPEFRRDAVARLIASGEKLLKDKSGGRREGRVQESLIRRDR